MSDTTTKAAEYREPAFMTLLDISLDVLRRRVRGALGMVPDSAPYKVDPTPALLDIVKEFSRQEQKWGVQDHTPPHWIAIMTEELGEAAKASVNACLGGDDSRTKEEWLADYRTELVQLGALAVQAIACIDRGEWEKPQGPEVKIEALDWHGTELYNGVRCEQAYGVVRGVYTIDDGGEGAIALREGNSTISGIPSVDEAKALAETRHRKTVLRAIGVEPDDAE